MTTAKDVKTSVNNNNNSHSQDSANMDNEHVYIENHPSTFLAVTSPTLA